MMMHVASFSVVVVRRRRHIHHCCRRWPERHCRCCYRCSFSTMRSQQQLQYRAVASRKRTEDRSVLKLICTLGPISAQTYSIDRRECFRGLLSKKIDLPKTSTLYVLSEIVFLRSRTSHVRGLSVAYPTHKKHTTYLTRLPYPPYRTRP